VVGVNPGDALNPGLNTLPRRHAHRSLLAVKNAKETLHDRRRKKHEVQKKTEKGG
jgi:hypothetical protein